jgi:hypothetical protein
MVFSYYKKLSVAQQKAYRQSDAITAIPFPGAPALHPFVQALAFALAEADRGQVEDLCGRIARGITNGLSIPTLRVCVRAVRPSASWGELHGLYEPAGGRATAVITLWMRTAKHRRVVAFKSFLRTLLHELCHHVDYEFYRLPDSFHTEGFYRREASLFNQLFTDCQRS